MPVWIEACDEVALANIYGRDECTQLNLLVYLKQRPLPNTFYKSLKNRRGKCDKSLLVSSGMFAEYYHSCEHNSKYNLKEYINKDSLTRFL